MKKILSIALFLSIYSVFAQEFEITPNGLKEKTTGKNYAVIIAEGKTASQLYNSTIKYININYKNPQEVIKSDLKNEYIKWETYVPVIGMINNTFISVAADATITMQLFFKDGKAKFEIVSQDIRNSKNKGPLGHVMIKGRRSNGFPIYDEKDDKLIQEDLKKDIESYYNMTIAKIKEVLLEDDSDW
jgi:hypothetical protein